MDVLVGKSYVRLPSVDQRDLRLRAVYGESEKEHRVATVESTAAALEAARNTVGEAEPVYMINMVRYRDQADYEGRLDLPACSGREAYFQRYAPACNNT